MIAALALSATPVFAGTTSAKPVAKVSDSAAAAEQPATNQPAPKQTKAGKAKSKTAHKSEKAKSKTVTQ